MLSNTKGIRLKQKVEKESFTLQPKEQFMMFAKSSTNLGLSGNQKMPRTHRVAYKQLTPKSSSNFTANFFGKSPASDRFQTEERGGLKDSTAFSKPSKARQSFSFEVGNEPKFTHPTPHLSKIESLEENEEVDSSPVINKFGSTLSTNHGEPKYLIGRSSEVCSICFEKIYSGKITTVEECKHALHEECFLPYLQGKIKEGVVNLTCPFNECPSKISERFLRQVLQPSDLQLYYRFCAFSFVERMTQQMDGCKNCSQPNCKQIIKFQKKFGYTTPPFIYCRTNRKKMCSKCLGEYHPQYTCAEFLSLGDEKVNEQKLLSAVKNNGWQRCPNCKVYVEKNQGCNHIKCRCKYDFCYVCSGPYPKCKCPSAAHFNDLPPEFLPPRRR